MATLQAIIDEVREMVGDPDTTELPDSKISNILSNRTLDWINKRRSGSTIGSFTTVASQQTYDSKPANAYKVTRVWWQEASFEFFSPSMRFVPGEQDLNVVMSGFSVIENPALVTAFLKEIESYRYNFKGRGQEDDNGQIFIAPMPGNTGDTVYFEYDYPRWASIITVADEYLQGIKYFAAAQVLQYLFIKRGRVRGVRSGSFGGGEN